ncbi:MAG: alpha/beta hydrolase, partial [Candidatus Eremiobacteraeota bacterium]|nr:alpha/beta hydrolase [Candidatus Eremiobacteraeota bacterium]
LALVASHVAEDASRNANADPAQCELAAGRDALAERLEREDTMEAAVASYLPRYFAPSVYRERPELVVRVRAIMQRQSARGSAQLVRGMKERLDSHDLLEDVRVPALVIAGAQDAYLKAETLREIAAAIAGAAFVQLDGVGHLPMFEAPAETANALATFAQRVHG